MASTQESQKLFSREKVNVFLHEPSGTTAEAVEWVDIRDYGLFGGLVKINTATGAISKVEIVASAASDGSNPEVIKEKDDLGAGTSGDQIVIECQAEEVRDIGEREGKDLRYVSVRITHSDAGDDSLVTYIRQKPRWSHDALTTDVIE